jgi:hypothetical protein
MSARFVIAFKSAGGVLDSLQASTGCTPAADYQTRSGVHQFLLWESQRQVDVSTIPARSNASMEDPSGLLSEERKKFKRHQPRNVRPFYPQILRKSPISTEEQFLKQTLAKRKPPCTMMTYAPLSAKQINE